MSNIAGKAYAMSVITPSKPRLTWINRFVFMFARQSPGTLGGLIGLSLIHFARWVIIKPGDWPDLGQGKQNLKNDYMLFSSNFNGTWDQYIDAFSDGIPSGLNLFWITATGYPLSIPSSPFKNYITHNQINNDYYYNATPGSAQRDIKGSIRVYESVLKLQKAHSEGADAFAKVYQEEIGKIQSNLGEPGFGPVASLSTERADMNRQQYENDHQTVASA